MRPHPGTGRSTEPQLYSLVCLFLSPSPLLLRFTFHLAGAAHGESTSIPPLAAQTRGGCASEPSDLSLQAGSAGGRSALVIPLQTPGTSDLSGLYSPRAQLKGIYSLQLNSDIEKKRMIMQMLTFEPFLKVSCN